MKKILVIRFSSIGDIVLTTPVIRCIRQCLPGVELHYLTRTAFSGILHSNPVIDKVHHFDKNIGDIIPQLRKEKYDLVIDLHKNLRSLRVKLALGTASVSFQKLNFKKWLLVRFKRNKLPAMHIVERYLATVEHLGVKYDGQGLDYFIPWRQKIDTEQHFGLKEDQYLAVAVGAAHFTKRIPLEKLKEIAQKSPLPIVALGGKEDVVIGQTLSELFPDKVINACGNYSLNESASIVQQAKQVITADTGLMHIAAAFQKDIVVLWGNTVPELGMYPFLEERSYQSMEVKDLACRPCSKIGFQHCPKGHFNCMQQQDISKINFSA